jgi:FKBP-type peptidyl-prolyl cis-trans isomerase
MLPRGSTFFPFLLLLLGGAALAQTPVKAPLSDAARKELAVRNLRAGEEILAANGKRPGVFTTYKGLQYEVLKPGEGAHPTPTDVVTVRFQWSLPDGTKLPVMDSGSPVTVRADNLVEGFAAAVQLMSVGAKWRIWLPPALAFGEAGRGGLVGPNQVLVIDCELFGIRPLDSRFPDQSRPKPPARPSIP